MVKKQFGNVTIVPARLCLEELFQVVCSLGHTGSLEKVEKVSVACCEQLGISIADKINWIQADLFRTPRYGVLYCVLYYGRSL